MISDAVFSDKWWLKKDTSLISQLTMDAISVVHVLVSWFFKRILRQHASISIMACSWSSMLATAPDRNYISFDPKADPENGIIQKNFFYKYLAKIKRKYLKESTLLELLIKWRSVLFFYFQILSIISFNFLECNSLLKTF